MKTLARSLLVGALVPSLVTACKDATGTHGGEPIALRVPASAVVLESDSITLGWALVDAAGDTLAPQRMVWLSEDTSVARIDAGGTVHSVRPGATTVFALAGGLAARVAVTSAVRYTLVAVGASWTGFAAWCGLTDRGSLYCYRPFYRTQPALWRLATPPGARLTAITVGGTQVCALDADGRAYCWGVNTNGSLGSDTLIGTTTEIESPVAVTGGLRFSSISAGTDHTCGLTPSGSAYCWGSKADGRIGDGDSAQLLYKAVATSPAAVTGGLTFASISAGVAHTCALQSDGSAFCWGSNASGQLGLGALTTTKGVRPRPVSFSVRFATVSAGLHTCALGLDGTAYCWGTDAHSALGYSASLLCGSLPCSLSPHSVPVSSPSMVGAGNDLSCAVITGGAAYCWGDGPLGDGLGDTTEVNPVAVAGGQRFRAIAVGNADACGTDVGGIVYCWGYNFGLLPQRLPFQP